MMDRQKDGQPEGRRLRKAVDGPIIEKWYALMPTAELAQRLGLTEKQIENYVYRENHEQWASKNAAVKSRINSENGKKGGRPRKKR